MSITVVADSASDLSPQEAAALGVELVPILVRFGSAEYRDGVDLSLEDFYAKLNTSKEHPSTAPPTEAMFSQAFERQTSAGNEVIAILISSKLSAMYENARAAAAAFSGKVHIVDSKSISGGCGLLVRAAARAARAGADVKTILASLERWIASQHGYSAYPELKYLERSGRINKAQLVLGTLMKMVPIIRTDPDGSLQSEATARTFETARELLVTIALRHIRDKNAVHIAVVHSGVPDLGKQVAGQLREKLGESPKELAVYEAGPTIAANAGPGAVSIFYFEE